MVYEVDGPAVSVGDRSIPSFKEVHRLEYKSETEWVDTVIESPSVDLGRYGVGSNVGSYRSLSGKAITEYSAMDGGTNESTVSEDAVFLPTSAFVFASHRPDLLDDIPELTKSQVVTSAKVCFNGDCEENAGGILYEGDRIELVLADDSRGIPLRVGDLFLVREVQVHDIRR